MRRGWFAFEKGVAGLAKPEGEGCIRATNKALFFESVLFNHLFGLNHFVFAVRGEWGGASIGEDPVVSVLPDLQTAGVVGDAVIRPDIG